MPLINIRARKKLFQREETNGTFLGLDEKYYAFQWRWDMFVDKQIVMGYFIYLDEEIYVFSWSEKDSYGDLRWQRLAYEELYDAKYEMIQKYFKAKEKDA